MVFEYYGKSQTTENLKKSLKEYYTDIVHSEGAAIYAAQLGFNVNMYLFDTSVITSEVIQAETNLLAQAIQESLENDDLTKYTYEKLNIMARAIEVGVSVRIQVPPLTLLTSAVDGRIPPIVSVRANLLYDTRQPRSNIVNHSVVVVGYDEKNIWVNDPGSKLEGVTDPYPIERNRFTMAWYQCSARTILIDNR